ncbi:probable E3 ubiquitin-protein ligase MGRN1 isoform X2 [Condylostylus longicornis]|uniref:probable E3 ubiquitin-protein ligase MGRN1 isoform X2 n=1 Tax=Condylostylus longicornis TaxID=2530218 RepID=UPI00244E38FC|nr:probable E3 ubiquitin-protein ligase MGRN1 isoform X2 [Condylostylus longicornis]
MGSLTSRQSTTVEETDLSASSYKYPPKTGNYFGSHFIMGGERFDTPQPEAYLFGENADLNFLGGRPTAFPYPPPQANEPTKTLKSLVNIRKESVRFVKSSENIIKNGDSGGGVTITKSNSFNIEFIFDSDASCAITIYYFCTEEISANSVTYIPRDSSLTSETYRYKKGVNQYFSQPLHMFHPNLYSDEELSYKSDADVFPVAIHCVIEEGAEDSRQSHTTICVVDHHSDGTYALRALKQKIFVDGLSYLLQEIYGIENKTLNKPAIDEDTDDNGSECVICMSDTRDTLILPCRHLCLCNSCADSLRYQANNCPICRAPFRALLQIRAVKKGVNSTSLIAQNAQDTNSEHIPPGYIPVSLIEALNGPPQVCRNNSVDSGDILDGDTVQGTDLHKLEKKSSPKSGSQKRSKKSKDTSSEFRISTTKSVEDNIANDNNSVGKNSPPPTVNNRRSSINSEKSSGREKSHKRQSSRESLQIINERHSVKLQSPTSKDVENDSDVEKLSPLLSPNDKEKEIPLSTLKINDVEESVDDTDQEDLPIDAQKKEMVDNNDTTSVNNKTSSTNSSVTNNTIPSPIKNIKDVVNSLPDSPISGNSASTRSSGDSYSSSASTKHLLSSNQPNTGVEDKQKTVTIMKV